MTTLSGYPVPKPDPTSDDPKDLRIHGRELSTWIIKQGSQGKLNCTTTVTLAAGTTTTTLTDARLTPGSVILLMPTTSNAAGAVSGLYVSARGKGTATLTHANTGTTDRTFGVAIIG